MHDLQQRCQRILELFCPVIRALELWEIAILSPLFFYVPFTQDFAAGRERIIETIVSSDVGT